MAIVKTAWNVRMIAFFIGGGETRADAFSGNYPIESIQSFWQNLSRNVTCSNGQPYPTDLRSHHKSAFENLDHLASNVENTVRLKRKSTEDSRHPAASICDLLQTFRARCKVRRP
jgi:hypothetical protein